MKVDKIICDRCGKETENFGAKECSARLTIWGVGVPRYQSGQRMDFCEKCFNEFINFLEETK